MAGTWRDVYLAFCPQELGILRSSHRQIRARRGFDLTRWGDPTLPAAPREQGRKDSGKVSRTAHCQPRPVVQDGRSLKPRQGHWCRQMHRRTGDHSHVPEANGTNFILRL